MNPAGSSTPIARIAVIDDHPFFRDGIATWIGRQPGLVCCGQAASISAARALLAESKPDLVLLDLQLQDGDGLDLLRTIVGQPDAPRVIVISHKDQELFAERAIRAGARGYIMKEEATESVMVAIQAVLAGGVHVNPSVSRRLLQRVASPIITSDNLLHKLTDRELQVYQMLGRGLSTKVIASELGLSAKTVDSYRESMKKKLGLPDAVALIRHATLWEQDRHSSTP